MRERLVITVCLAILAICAFTIFSQFQQEHAQVEEIFRAQTSLLTAPARRAIESKDMRALEEAVEHGAGIAVGGNNYATAVAFTVLDVSGRSLAGNVVPVLRDELTGTMVDLAQTAAGNHRIAVKNVRNLLIVGMPILDRGAPAGAMAVAWDVQLALAAIRANTVKYAAAATVASLLAMLLVMVMLDYGMIGPLKRLQAHAAHIARLGDPCPIADQSLLKRGDEIGALATAFNSMIAEIAKGARLLKERNVEISLRNMQFDIALANMSQGLCMYDANGRLALFNDRFVRIFDLAPDVFVKGATYLDVLEIIHSHGRLQDESVVDVFKEHQAALETAALAMFSLYLTDERVISITQVPMRDGGWVATYEDITERLSTESQITHMAHYDTLTELPNRVLFRQELEQALMRVEQGVSVAVLCLDLDHFKSVNDTLGHPVGDKLLNAVAGRLRGCLRENDTVARLGGDEFAVVQTGVENLDDASILAARIIERLSAPFEIAGHQVVIGASVGIAFAPHDGSEADHLLKCADMALFRAKSDGRGTHRFFEQEMDARMQARRLLELDLRAALSKNEFMVYFQPLIDMETNTVGGFEALLRWQHPVRGMVSPDNFIPLAEEIGLINDIGLWVLKEACKAAATWREPIKVAVNLSPVQFKSKTLVADVKAALLASGLPPRRLELEITESVLLTNSEQTLSILHEFRDLGIAIAMDDFGTGYSSLSYLQSFPFDRIKIDRSFVRELQTKPNSLAIIKAITDLGVSLGIATTAEGVETSEQLERLRSSGCSVAQGYLFSQAIPQSSIPALIELLERGNEAESRAA